VTQWLIQAHLPAITPLAGHIVVATDDGALMLFSPSGSGVDASAADDEE
jgi:hypothetical protein